MRKLKSYSAVVRILNNSRKTKRKRIFSARVHEYSSFTASFRERSPTFSKRNRDNRSELIVSHYGDDDGETGAELPAENHRVK